MRVPLFVVGFSMVWSLMLVSLTNDTAAVCGCAAGALVLIVSLVFSRIRKGMTVAASAAAVTAACALFLIKSAVCYYPALELSGQSYTFSGTVTEASYDEEYDTYRYIVKVDSVKEKSCGNDVKMPLGFKVRMSSKYFQGNINDKVMFSGKLYKLGESLEKENAELANSMYRYYRSKGYCLGVTVYGDVNAKEGEKYSVLSLADTVRSFSKSTLEKYLNPDYAHVLLGMLDGDKSHMPADIYENFKLAGVVHLLSVSGFHTSLWSMLLYRGLLKLGADKKAGALYSMIFLLAFIPVTGFSRSTIRASIMLELFFLGRLLKRSPDSLNSLGLSALLICLLDPFACLDTGFLLSFFSTLGILVLYPHMKNFIRPKIKRIVHNFYTRQRVNEFTDTALISVCTLAFTFPLIMLFFGDISFVSPISNLIISPLASCAIFLSGIGVFFSIVPGVDFVTDPIFLISGIFTKLIIEFSAWFSKIPMSSVSISEDYIKVTVAALLVLYALAVVMKIENKRLVAALSAVIILGTVTSHCILTC